MEDKKVELGATVRDTVSGFAGVVIGITTFLHGCLRAGVQPPVDQDGKLPDAVWFDVPQLRVTPAAKHATSGRDLGGPMVSMPTRNMPG